MRDLVAAAESSDGAAALALEVYTHRIRSYVGAYAAQLGRVDAIVFTARRRRERVDRARVVARADRRLRPQPTSRAQSMQSVAVGRASRRATVMRLPQRAQMP